MPSGLRRLGVGKIRRFSPVLPAVPRRITLGTLMLVMGIAACELTSVVPLEVDLVEVDPPILELLEGEQGQVSATPLDATGRALQGRAVDWTVSDQRVLRVDVSGTVHALASGSAQVVARIAGRSGEARVTVLPGPGITLNPDTILLEARVGQEEPVDALVTVVNSGFGVLDELVAEVLQVPAAPWLDVELGRSTAPTDLSLRADVSGLGGGLYEGHIRVSSPQALRGSPATLVVGLRVDESPPELRLVPDNVAFSGIAGSATVSIREVEVTNVGGGEAPSMTVRIIHDNEPPAPWLDAELTADHPPTTLILRASPRRLPPGEYGATVLVSTPQAEAPGELTVTMQVGSRP